MNDENKRKYIEAYANIIGLNEEKVKDYVSRKGMAALINNTDELLTTKTQREKYEAFIRLYRMSNEIRNDRPILDSPGKVARFAQSIMEQIHDKESVVVTYLNSKMRLIDYEEISVGTIDTSLIHSREVFKRAIRNKAHSIILCHNHPSGDTTPSRADESITRKMIESGNILGIKVLDHVIIGGINKGNYFSFADSGIMMESRSKYNNSLKATNKRNRKPEHEENEELDELVRNFFDFER